jgi:hypothetical protein
MKKGIFWWKVPLIEKGEPARIAPILKEAGISRIDVKVAEGSAAYKVPIWNHPTWGLNVKRDWVSEMQNLGFEVWGYGFCYGVNPAGEGMIAAQQVSELKLDGYIFNVESKFDSFADAPAKARTVVDTFRYNSLPVKAALVSWPLFNSPWTGSRWHRSDVAKVFMERLDYSMPMCYWWNTHALLWLEHAIRQWKKFVSPKPIVPVGRAYSGEGLGTINVAEMIQFGKRVRELDLVGESWWALHTARKVSSGRYTRPVWDAIRQLPPIGNGDPPPPPPNKLNIEIRVPAGKTDVTITEV